MVRSGQAGRRGDRAKVPGDQAGGCVDESLSVAACVAAGYILVSLTWLPFLGTLVRMAPGHRRSSPLNTGKLRPARSCCASGSARSVVQSVVRRSTHDGKLSENLPQANQQPSLIARNLCSLAVFAAIVAALVAFEPVVARAGCGDYIHFRAMQLPAMSGLTGGAVQAASPSHANPKSRMWFSTTLARSLGKSPVLPDDSRRTPCNGPACRQQPSSPLLPAAAFMGLFPPEALLFADRLPEPPRCEWHVTACVAYSPSFRPSDIFRPPR